jgi:asparagine N-glycosylation enzyme membrane subunit Stt3
MTASTLQQLIPVIQTAVGPVILISGVGLLLLSMTNRFGRVLDRARLVAGGLPTATATTREHLFGQLAILYRRAKIIRLAIILAAASLLLAGLLIISLFLAALLQAEVVMLVMLCFILCMASLIASLVMFLLDLQMSLKALRVELTQAGFREK